MEEHERGPDQFESEEAFRLHRLRHSTAHVLAAAVMRLHPEARLAIGPPIQDGFYYDIELENPLSETDLDAIAAAMKAIVKENNSFDQETWDKARARVFFAEHEQPFKLELIEGIEGDTVSIYTNKSRKGGPDFVDLCAGPHVARTGQCKHFKLTKVSGAYWRADATKAQLTRVYGTVWPTRDELDAYLFRVEEAKKRDHRKLGRELDLFMMHDYAPGSAFWLPRGEHVYHTLSDNMRRLLASDGYQVVRTPLVFHQKLWETSGHWGHYQDNMYCISAGKEDEAGYGLKPMNCPSHMLIFGSRPRSYRELPMRIHDQGVLHRNEVSGALSGLTRVRQFCQDDAHLFCMEEQLGEEATKLLDLIDKVYSAFDMGYRVKLSTRPEDRMGADELWDKAEDALRQALEARGIDYTLNPGDGAFYGPKIDFDLIDALGRAFQCATIQVDFQMPRRFELSYVGADNESHVPVVIHRAIFGSFERFIAILIEHYGGRFPTWLAPEQVRILTVSEKSLAWGEEAQRRLAEAGFRAVLDGGDHKIGYKIREAHAMKLPYMAIVGERDMENGTLSVRTHEGDLGALPLEDFMARLAEESVVPF